MSKMLDKNGKPLKGGAIWLRKISLDGGLEEHDKKVAIQVFSDFLDSRPEVSAMIAQQEVEKRRNNFKIVNGNEE